LTRLFNSLSLEEIMEQQGNDSLFGVINKPPSFSGRKCDLEGFLTRAELAMESRPNQFHDDSAKGKILNVIYAWETFGMGFSPQEE